MLKINQIALMAFTAGALAAFSARAHEGANTCTGFHGVANFQQGLVLTATTNAPARATGKANFIAVDDNGTNYELLFVKTTGLTNGPYSVSVSDETLTNIFTLGTLNVRTEREFGDCGWGPAQGFFQHDWKWFPGGWFNNWDNWLGQCSRGNSLWKNLQNPGGCTNLWTFETNAFCWFTNTATVGSGRFMLPPGLSQTNVTLIFVTDPNGLVDLTGDFAATTNSTVVFKEIASIVPGTATNAQGTATITYRLFNSKTVGTFKLEASGLPARQKLFLTADGTNTFKVFTSNKGKLDVRSFPHVNVATITDVVATDTSSNIVFTVNF